MPIVQIKNNVELPPLKRETCIQEIAVLVSTELKKPLSDTMILWQPFYAIMNGSSAALAYIEIRVLSGLTTENSRLICMGMADIFQKYFSIDTNRIYVNFAETEPNYAWRFIQGQAVCPQVLVL